MVERTTSTRLYIIAGIITLLIFLVGLFIGTTLTNERANAISTDNERQRLDIESTQLQYVYLSSLKDQEQSCGAALKTLEININNLENTRKKLETYISSAITENEDFISLKREYMIAELRYWILARQTQELCGRDAVILLYFYSNNDCSDCSSQGIILTNLKDLFGEKLLIFSIDADFSQEPLISIIKENYKINELPTIIIYDKKFSGIQTEQELEKVICENLDNSTQLCAAYS